MKLKIQIKSIYGAVLFEFEKENNTQRETILEAIKQKANLSYADLSYADLSYADLRYADLRYANLRSANLSYADLSYANLSYANLSYADLSSADLSSANLRYANLRYFKNDLWEILLRTKNEILGLKQKINEGKIDGFVYEGECCCLVGTIAVVRNCNYKSIPGVEPSASRPAEQWFSQFRKDMTPENNDKLKLTMEWIEEFEMLLN